MKDLAKMSDRELRAELADRRMESATAKITMRRLEAMSNKIESKLATVKLLPGHR